MTNVVYSKKIHIGTVSGSEWGYVRRLPVEIDVELVAITKGLELRMTGSIWRPQRGDIVSGGQNYDTIADLFPENEKVQRMIAVWRRWHLNGLNAGCEHQRAFAQACGCETHVLWDTSNGKRPKWSAEGDYGRQLVHKAPVVCPICDYSYGSQWLYEELPAEIVNEVKEWS